MVTINMMMMALVLVVLFQFMVFDSVFMTFACATLFVTLATFSYHCSWYDAQEGNANDHK